MFCWKKCWLDKKKQCLLIYICAQWMRLTVALLDLLTIYVLSFNLPQGENKIKVNYTFRRLKCWCFGLLLMTSSTSCQETSDSVQQGQGHHLALRIPDNWLWSAKCRKTIRLNLHLFFTPRGREVITHLFRILTGQLSLGSAAISKSAITCKQW